MVVLGESFWCVVVRTENDDRCAERGNGLLVVRATGDVVGSTDNRLDKETTVKLMK